jgi:hypothetical protein
MAALYQHVAECKVVLGNGWPEVHIWLDEYAAFYHSLLAHRAFRHHCEGVEEVRRRWGDEAAKAAEIHIARDEGAVPTKLEMLKRYGKTLEQFGVDPGSI